MAPKSKFRQPGTQHFQLVHRSQRDPLIHDPDASTHVLKAFERGNVAKGKSRAELERALSPSDLAHDATRANIGEASLYGVYFDDTDYDYMQHLRTAGLQEDGVESILIEAPSKPKGNSKAKDPITLVDLPPEILPSAVEMPRNYEAQQAVPSSIAGFQPDMDPHLRQVLEALEDDAFVDDDLEDDFFGELVQEGERATDEELDFEFHEDGIPDGEDGPAPTKIDDEKVGSVHHEEEEEEGEGDVSWEARFARFKAAQKHAPPAELSDIDSEGGDTVGALPELSVIGGKRKRKGASDASGYSMSSSSMFRNEGLTTLDERFDQIQKEYESDEAEDEDANQASDSDEAPELLTSREDFDQIMDEFLEQFEILGGKMKPILPGETGTEKLDTLRRELGQAVLRDHDGDSEDDDDDDVLMPLERDEKERWDCETILTTYSNLENHPRLIRVRQQRPVPKITIDPKTGLPIVKSKSHPDQSASSDDDDDDDEEADHPQRVTITRPKNESKEDKKLRKQTVKAERQSRRVDKKAMKELFSTEMKNQTRTLVNKDKLRMKKL